MLLNILVPTGLSSPKSVLFNYDWMTFIVMLVILVIGALYFVPMRPDRSITRAHPPLVEAAATPPAAE